MTHVGVPVQQTQTQLSLVTNPIPVNQHLGWPQLVTPLIVGQPRTMPYLMWYNIVPPLYLWILTCTQCIIQESKDLIH
jgi:hypothetical protein